VTLAPVPGAPAPGAAAGPLAARSALDSARFGVPVARAAVPSAAAVPGVVAGCRADGTAMLIARCPARDLAAAQALEAAGARLMDVLLYAARDLVRAPVADHPLDGLLRPATPADADAVAGVAALGFAGYQSHYHADPRLDPAACDAAYVEWARRSVESPAVADAVVVAEAGGEVVGFATVKRTSKVEADAVLFAVAPGAERHGVYRADLYAALMLRSLRWARGEGARRMTTSTQLTNVAVQKLWQRTGFEPSRAELTFHLWLDGGPAA
jgi:GNAT superfamily N-acetyltransferase